jgi:hypothetical protein
MATPRTAHLTPTPEQLWTHVQKLNGLDWSDAGRSPQEAATVLGPAFLGPGGAPDLNPLPEQLLPGNVLATWHLDANALTHVSLFCYEATFDEADVRTGYAALHKRLTEWAGAPAGDLTTTPSAPGAYWRTGTWQVEMHAHTGEGQCLQVSVEPASTG